MVDADVTAPLGEVRAKLALLKRLEAEHTFGVIIEEPASLEPIPELPVGVIEVFSLFRRVGGTYFHFFQPEEISSPDAWANRVVDPESPLASSLLIGIERYSVPEAARDDIDGADVVYLDTEDGSVFYLDPDDFADSYKNPDEGIEVEEFASDIVTFFNEYVFGAKYSMLVDTILGPGARERRERKGKHRGQYADSWLRLLVAADLAS
jgi:hypothetical protein